MISDKFFKFIKGEYKHWLVSRLEQQKFETEIELKQWKDIDDGSQRVKDQIEIIEEQLTNLRMRLAIKLEERDRHT